MRTIRIITIAALVAVFGSIIPGTPVLAHGAHDGMKGHKSAAALDLRLDMRKLWVDHVTWTRNVILCIADDLPGTDQAVKRLLQNQVDIGNAIKPVYGEAAGKKLTELLTQHIVIAADLLKAGKTGNTEAFASTSKKWTENADDIALFLHNANSHWELEEMKTMMHSHLKLTIDEAVARLKKNYDADVLAYDSVFAEIMKMSDMLTDGIVQQHPKMFVEKDDD